MTPGMLVLTLLAVGVFCGLLQRVLDRMYLTDRQALLLIGIMLIGTFIPNLQIGTLAINIGGMIPAAICIYLMVKTDTAKERLRSIVGCMITAAAILALSMLMPAEAEQMPFDPMWVYGVVGGVVAWLAGRSRRCAFICGTLGVILADTFNWLVATLQGYNTTLVLGGGGIADAAVISGVLAVLFCELLGEAIERIVGMKRSSEQRS